MRRCMAEAGCLRGLTILQTSQKVNGQPSPTSTRSITSAHCNTIVMSGNNSHCYTVCMTRSAYMQIQQRHIGHRVCECCH